jgi:hypothetical protein
MITRVVMPGVRTVSRQQPGRGGAMIDGKMCPGVCSE